MQTLESATLSKVTGTLNFPKERRGDFAFSNFRPEWRTLEVFPHEIEIRDARELSDPRLDREGFELHVMPIDNPRWTDEDWVQGSYLPALRELVLERTGAAEAISFPRSWVLRDTTDSRTAPPTLYVHMDRERENCRAIVRNHFGDDILHKYKRFENLNIWRSLTPPPQDYPLALCDQRTNDPQDWMAVQTLEPNLIEEMKDIVSLHSPAQRWYYFSNLQPDEIVVFRNYNDDPAGPHGCLHSAFLNEAERNPVPRASFEIRLYLFYED